MIFIPMGIGQSYPRLPIVTFVISACLLAFYSFGFSNAYTEKSAQLIKGARFEEIVSENYVAGCSLDRNELCREQLKTWKNLIPTVGLINIEVLDLLDKWDFLQEKGPLRFVYQIRKGEIAGRVVDEWKDEERRLDESFLALQLEYRVASPKNLNISSLFFSFLHHGNWAHLVFNLIPLFMFGSYVEMRLGRWPYALFVVVASSLSLAPSILLSPNRFGIMGASGGVFALMGAFYALFFRHKIKMFLWYLVVFTKIRVRVSWFMPLFFLFGEFLGLMIELFLQTNVAHSAHIAGFAIGLIFGMVWSGFEKFKYPFIYKEEFSLFERGQYAAALELNDLNPLTKKAFMLQLESGPLVEDAKKRYIPLFQDTLRGKLATMDPLCLEDIRKVPIGEMGDYLRGYGFNELAKIGDVCLDQGAHEEALRCYGLLLEKFLEYPKAIGVAKTVKNIFEALLAQTGEEAAVNEKILDEFKDIEKIYQNTLRETQSLEVS